jgi:hypothetical protein
MHVKNVNTVYVSVHFSTSQIGKIFDIYIELHNFRTNTNCYRYLELPWLPWSYWLIERWIYYKIIEQTYLVKRLKLLSHTTFLTWKYPDVWRRLSILLTVPKHWLLGVWYSRGLIVHQQWYRPTADTCKYLSVWGFGAFLYARLETGRIMWLGMADGRAGWREHRFPHNNFSSVYRIFTKLGHMIPLWKGKNPIYFGVIRSKSPLLWI